MRRAFEIPDSDWEIWDWNERKPVALVDGTIANPMIITNQVRAGKIEYRQATAQEQADRARGLEAQEQRIV